ncbi:MAG: vWA domain-containing protein [Patescibacteria group bacterium]
MAAHAHGASRRGPIAVTFSLSRRAVPPGRPGSVWVLARLAAARPPRPGNGRRLPLNLGLVLDRGGAMAGAPLDHAKRAACRIVEQMGAEDLFSLAVFDGEVEVIRPAGRVMDRDADQAAIARIRHGGGTANLPGGLLRGGQEVRRHAAPGLANRVLILAGGRAGVDMSGAHLLAAKSGSLAEEGVPVSTVGVGERFDEDLLLALAEAGRGNYYYLRTPDGIQAALDEELAGLLSVTAQNLRVTARPGAGCRVTGVLGYEPHTGPEGIILSLPDMCEHEARTLLLEVVHPALAAGEHELLHFNLAYADVLGGSNAVDLFFTVRLPASADPGAQAADFAVIKAVELARAALARDRAVEAMDRGEFNAAGRVLRERGEALNGLNAAVPAPDAEIAAEVAELESLALRMEGLAAGGPKPHRPERDLRKSMRYQSYLRRRGR